MALERQLWTVNGLSVELQFDRRTLGKKLSDLDPAKVSGKIKYYYMADVHKHLIGGAGGGHKIDDYKLRKEKAGAEMAEIELGLMKDEIIYVNELQDHLTPMLSNFRGRALNMPRKLAAQLASVTDAVTIEEAIQEEVNQMLNEFAEYDPKRSPDRKNNRKLRKGS